MHYYNVPCDTDPDSPFNPLNMIQSIYKPGDYVVLKLDIDNEEIEQVCASVPNDSSALHDMRNSFESWTVSEIDTHRVSHSARRHVKGAFLSAL